MKKLRTIISLCLLILWQNISFGAQALFQIEAVSAVSSQLETDQSKIITYKVTSNMRSPQTLAVSPIQATTQVTTMSRACSAPAFVLTQGESCYLYLKVNGPDLKSLISGGPMVCTPQDNNNNTPHPLQLCSQPPPADRLNVEPISPRASLDIPISVIVQETVSPSDIQTYVSKIKRLAPNLKQMHLRFAAGATNYQDFADQIAYFHATFGDDLVIGFHPDNSSSSYSFWNCTVGDWQCVFSATIRAMEKINQIADPERKGIGIKILSLEQSYVEPPTAENYANMVACTDPANKAPGATCPGGVVSSYPVSLGNVTPSYGGANLFGPSKLLYAYAQYYNLGKPIIAEYSNLVQNFFPAYSALECIGSAAYPWTVVDVDSNDAYPPPKIPCFSQTPNVYTYTNPPTVNGPSPELAAAFLSFLMTQLEPISSNPGLNGGKVFITLSGEYNFLGAKGWTLDKISSFFQQLKANFVTLKASNPSLFPAGGADPDSIEYAIWNPADIIANN